MIALKNRVHLFTHPKNKEPLIDFFTTLLGCTVMGAPSSLAFQFVDGSAISVDFTEEVVEALDEKEARRGAWLELETDEPATLKERILAVGYRQFDYKGFFTFRSLVGKSYGSSFPEEEARPQSRMICRGVRSPSICLPE